MTIDPVALAAELIACPSITPASGAVFDVLDRALTPLGFTCHRWVMGEAPDGPTENMVAIRGEGSGISTSCRPAMGGALIHSPRRSSTAR